MSNPISEPHLYPLPANDIPDSVRKTLDRWVAGFIGCDVSKSRHRLVERWAGISRPSLLKLRAKLLEFEVRGIVSTDCGGMIYAVRPGTDERVVGNTFLLPGPMHPSLLEDRLGSVFSQPNDAVLDFITHFGGLSEEVASGKFVYAERPWPTFSVARCGDQFDGTKEFMHWEGALQVYHALDGSDVLVHPESGEVVWWIMTQRRIQPLASSFDDFVLQYAESRTCAWPFDPYGPDAEAMTLH